MKWELVYLFANLIYCILGTSPLRNYGYSHICTPAILDRKGIISKNLTCTATISF